MAQVVGKTLTYHDNINDIIVIRWRVHGVRVGRDVCCVLRGHAGCSIGSASHDRN